MQLNGAQILIKALQEQGVDTIFGYPGGAVLEIYDALKEMNLPKQASHISDVGKGKRKTAYGFIWRYIEKE